MDQLTIRKICSDRLGVWTDELVRDHSTPMILIGCGHDHHSGQLHLCITEDMDGDHVIRILEDILNLLLK